jgi:3-deoxy-D-manno-octulosonate 8-phosphate phosphatase KdsC-like HAD superfamily phosphatase
VIEMSNGKFFHVKDGLLIRLDLYLSTSEAIVAKQS